MNAASKRICIRLLLVFTPISLLVLKYSPVVHINLKGARYTDFLSFQEHNSSGSVRSRATERGDFDGVVTEGQISLASRSEINVLWLGADPIIDFSNFQYYKSFGKAISAHNSFRVCPKNLSACSDQVLSSSSRANKMLLLAIPHSVSTGLHKLVAVENELDEATQWMSTISLELEQHEQKGLNVVFGMFINKVYVQLDDKVSWFKRASGRMSRRLKHTPNKVKPLIFTWSSHAAEWEQKYAIPFTHVPFAADIQAFDVSSQCDWANNSCDVFLRWDTNPMKYSTIREQLSQILGTNSNVQIFNKNSEQFFNIMSPTSFLSDGQYLKMLRTCKVHVSSIGMPGEYDLVGTRYFEVMASGCALLFVERPQLPNSKLAYDRVGLKEDENVVMFATVGEFLEKLAYYTTDLNRSQAIVNAARKQALNNTWAKRIDQVAAAIYALMT